MMYNPHRINSMIDQRVRAIVHRIPRPKLGYVTSYNPDTYAVRVRFEPESSASEANGGKPVESNWIPMFRGYGGNGWGMVTPPKADPQKPYGDMALVIAVDGADGFALVGFPTDKEKQVKDSYPSAVTGSFTGVPDNGDLVWVHPTGGYIRMVNNGSIQIHNHAGCFIDMSEDGHIVVHSSTGADISMDSSGNIAITASGGAYVQLSNGSPVGPPGTSTNSNAVVTVKDLQAVVDQINTALAARQSGASANPNIVAKGSTTVKVTD